MAGLGGIQAAIGVAGKRIATAKAIPASLPVEQVPALEPVWLTKFQLGQSDRLPPNRNPKQTGSGLGFKKVPGSCGSCHLSTTGN
jgi:hypothetical protein